MKHMISKKDKKILAEGILSIGVAVRSIFYVFYLIFENIIGLFRKKESYLYSDVVNYMLNLTPREFEFFCAEIFRQMGYKDVKVTSSTNDYGRDIIMKDKNGECVFVECKYYRNEAIGREICQKLLGSMSMFGIDKGIIITTSRFHNNAYEVKRHVGDKLEFIDITRLLSIIKNMDNDSYRRIMMKSLNIA